MFSFFCWLFVVAPCCWESKVVSCQLPPQGGKQEICHKTLWQIYDYNAASEQNRCCNFDSPVELVVLIAVELPLTGFGVDSQVEIFQFKVDCVLPLSWKAVVVKPHQLYNDDFRKPDNLEFFSHFPIDVTPEVKSTVDRHKFNRLATNSTTFVAFSWPLYCM